MFVLKTQNDVQARSVYINGKSRYDPSNKAVILKHGDYISFGESNLFIFKYPKLNMEFKDEQKKRIEDIKVLEKEIDSLREKTHNECDFTFKKI